MRTIKQLTLLLFLFFIISGCAQQPAPPAMVTDGSNVDNLLLPASGSVDGTIVDDGFVIPNGPDIPDGNIVIPPDQPCRVKVKFRGMYYDGDDVGSEWKYRISVDGHIWNSGLRIVHYKTWDKLEEYIYDAIFQNGCNRFPVVNIFVRVRERDWCIFDDIGEGFDVTIIKCTEQISRQQILIKVQVPEYFWNLLNFLPRQHEKTALLTFFFEVSAVCE